MARRPKLTRQEKIDAIVRDVEDWDLENLIGWVQHELRLKLEAQTDKQVDSDYKACVLTVGEIAMMSS